MADHRLEFFNGVGYIAGEAEGAIPNGRRVRKVAEEDGDSTPLGTEGTVMSSVYEPAVTEHIFYFVMWETRVHPVGVTGWKIEEVPA